MRTLSNLMISIVALAAARNAMAEWAPGRERPVMEAQMAVSSTAGAFEGLRTVGIVKSIAADAGRARTFFTLRVLNKGFRFAVASAEMSDCGRTTYTLVPAETGIKLESRASYEVFLQEDTLWGASCGGSRSLEMASEQGTEASARGAARWTLIYKHSNFSRMSSLIAEGKPHFYVTTLELQADPAP